MILFYYYIFVFIIIKTTKILASLKISSNLLNYINYFYLIICGSNFCYQWGLFAYEDDEDQDDPDFIRNANMGFCNWN